MGQEDKGAGISPEKTGDSKGATIENDITGVARETPGDVMVNFRTPEFNHIDVLNDCAGNYRFFESLDGVLTAHERHQIEVRRRKDTLDPSGDQPSPRKPEGNPHEAEASEAAAPLTVISEGRTLIIDTDAERVMACGKTLRDHRLPCTLVVTGRTLADASSSKSDRIRLLYVNRVSVTGAFGGFSAEVTVGGKEKPLNDFIGDGAAFDLVLDLQPVPSFAGGRLPVGYYAPGASPIALGEALAELPEMRGQFKKPRFVAFDKNRCFHDRSRALDCRRCLEVCPVSAIRSVNRVIFINHYLCQGCGACTLVCRANALRMIQPPQKELLSSLRSSLEGRPGNGVSSLNLVISDSESANEFLEPDEQDRNRRIFFQVEQIAHVRLEVLLMALASGVAEVLVACDSQNPPAISEAVERQVQMARAILRGLGWEEERIRFLVMHPDTDLPRPIQPTASISKKNNRISAAPGLFPGCDGRALVYQAAQVLHDQSGGRQPWLPLPEGSPFGAIALNSKACTLCLACVGACPSGALSSRGDKAPRLLFQEFQCHQCGLCQDTCPERAIQLVPRLLLGHGAAEKETVLRETEPFRCVECGLPFASPAMIDRMKAKLAGHWMYGNERQLRRLQMCGPCRTRDALASPEMFPWKR